MQDPRRAESICEGDSYVDAASLGINDEWRAGKIIPAVDVYVDQINKRKITVLDIGGGTGVILKGVLAHMKTNYRIELTKFALEIISTLLRIQKNNNPDIESFFCRRHD